MEIVFSTTEIEEHFFAALCNVSGLEQGAGCRIDYKKKDYLKAREAFDSPPCYEDVLMKILKDGNKLTLVDEEDKQMWTITLQDVHNNFKLVPVNDMIDLIKGNDDACTAWNVLQAVFIKEVIFG